MAESRRVRDALTELESTLWLPGERLPEWEHKTQGGKNCQAVIRATGLLRDELTSSPWRPIEECGELEGGKEYLVRMKRGKLDELITIARWSGAEWQVRIGDAQCYYYRAEHITHVHQAGPIRGPGETT